MHRKLIVVGVALLLASAGCSSSPPSAMSDHSPFVKVPDTTTSTQPGISDTAPAPDSNSSAGGTPAPPKPCTVAKPTDLTDAGMQGKITQSSNASFSLFGDGHAPSSCVFLVTVSGVGLTNVLVMVDNGGAAQYQENLDFYTGFGGGYVSKPLQGLGDKAVLITAPPGPAKIGVDPEKRNVLVLNGRSVLGVEAVDHHITTASIEKLADIIAPRLP